VLVAFVGLMGVSFGILYSEAAYELSADFIPAAPAIPAILIGVWWLSKRTKQLFLSIGNGENHASFV